jgi:hypothetical protein
MFIPLGDDNSGRRITPYVVYGLVAANALVWYLQLSRGEPFTASPPSPTRLPTESISPKPAWWICADRNFPSRNIPDPRPFT